MINGLTIADPIAWKQAFLEYETAKAKLRLLERPCDEAILDATSDHFYEAEEALLTLPAPDLEAVIDKLMILWSEDIWYDQTESDQKRMVIGDLRRFQILALYP